MNILVAGQSGQLAVELLRCQWPAGTRISALGRGRLNIADPESVARAFADFEPDIVINAAAYTAVDRAETDSVSAHEVNQMGAGHLAQEAARHGIPLIHISTDYVFSGVGQRPWREDDMPNPASIYGLSKRLGEIAIQQAGAQHIILRTSWLFAAHGQNFVRTMLRLGADRDRLKIVGDQMGCPTPAADLARVIADISMALSSGVVRSGIYHYCGQGPVTWYEFAATIFDMAGGLVPQRPVLQPITTMEFGAPAPRPAYSVLDCGKLERDFGVTARPWLPGLQSVLSELQANAHADIGKAG